MEKLQFKLEVFEGPLDLLLHLIRKHKLNICDIEISQLLQQYLDYINEMKTANMDVASEFLEMAARLVYIKTCSLLPHSQEEEKLKQELTGRLLELQVIKQIAGYLAGQSLWGEVFVRQPMALEQTPEPYSRMHRPEELAEAYQAVIQKVKRQQPPPKSAFQEIVEHKVVSITSRVVYVLRKLYRCGSMPYEEFFGSGDRSEMVATFLAMLELVKSKRISISEDNRTVVFDRTVSEQEVKQDGKK